jgi:hypothetical protein
MDAVRADGEGHSVHFGHRAVANDQDAHAIQTASRSRHCALRYSSLGTVSAVSEAQAAVETYLALHNRTFPSDWYSQKAEQLAAVQAALGAPR